MLNKDYIPPHCIETECTILGSMLVSSDCADTSIEMLKDTSFYSQKHKHIFNAMSELYKTSIPIDTVTLSARLNKKEVLDGIGGSSYLAGLSESLCTASNIEHYCNILLEKECLRNLINSSNNTIISCLVSDVDANVALDQAESMIFNISEGNTKNNYSSTGSLLPQTFDDISGYQKGILTGIKSGFLELDELTNGFNKSDLIIIAGRPSMGKTAFCVSIASFAGVNNKEPVAIFSLEMSKQQLMQRILCGMSKVNMHSLRSGQLAKRDMPRLSLAAGPLSEAPIFIDDTPAITVLELRAKARRIKTRHGLKLIVIDYMQLMGSVNKGENRQQEISNISRALKGIAKELDVPVIALSQLSRAVESRTGNHRPQLSDLRESGAIEQDADVVLFVYRDEIYNKEDNDVIGKAEIIIGKQRNGPLGTANLAFLKEFASFENLTKDNSYDTNSWQN